MTRPVWFFDLDNTLHDASFRIFSRIDVTMNAFLVRHLDIDRPAADRLRLDYWQRYGATLIGLVKHHNVNPHQFLAETHDFALEADFAAMVRAERGLTRLFRRLPGRKVLLTNAPEQYANAVLRHIGLSRHFMRRYAIEQMCLHRRFRPKPAQSMLRMLVARERIRPYQAILVDDSAANLKSARAVGLRTVHVTGMVPPTGWTSVRRRSSRAAYVDRRVRSVGELARS